MVVPRPTRKFRIWLALHVIASTLGLPSARAQGHPAWPPVPPEEVALKDNAFEPGAPALILEYEVQTDNAKSTETTYKRIKIFREEGKKLADVEIRYFEKFTRVEEIQARVTSPSGKSEDFNGAIYDKDVVKLKKFRYSAKTFTLPNIEIGAVIEYSYRLHWHSDIPDVFKNPARYLITESLAYPAANWEIQQDIPLRHARFTLHPIKGARTGTFSQALPKDTVKYTLPDGTVGLEVNYVPGFQKEEYAPPEENVKVRADVFYQLGFFSDPNFYWLGLARREAEYYDKFIGNPNDVRNETERLFSSADSAETKLRKIYARVQQIRALSYEPEKTKKERKQESLKENKNAEDVLNHGYAVSNEINLVFIALARAAGFQAYPVRLAARNRAFFVTERLDPNQLNSLVAEVLVGTTSQFFDPATIYCPYGILPWEETDARGIRVNARDAKIQSTPLPESKDAVVHREAEFHLDPEGNLSGMLSVTYEGQEALQRRLKAIDQDEAERKKELEGQVQLLLPQGGTAKLLSAQGWTEEESPLKAKFEIQIPGYATAAGQRLLMPVGVFHSSGQGTFTSTRRTHPVYFDYPWESYEDIKLTLSPGVQIEALPPNTKIPAGNTIYEFSVEKKDNILQLKRTLKMASFYVQQEQYPRLRRFYELVRTGDEQQVVLKPLDASGKK
jgi:transglutaminase-like putative cysteine protease